MCLCVGRGGRELCPAVAKLRLARNIAANISESFSAVGWQASGMADEEEDPTFEEGNEEIGGGAEGGQGKRKRLFSEELRCMMYGFGDDQNPYTESVDILEDLVIKFITEMTHKAMSVGRQGRVQVEDIVFLIRKDPRKFARVKDLLTMNEELKRARKAFDEADYGS